MSILKIADEIDDLLKEQEQLPWGTKQVYLDLAAAIIRQQQAEIEALKKDNKELHAIAQRMAMAESDARKSLQWFKDAKERQSEPIAWMLVDKSWNDFCRYSSYPTEGATPLYTHPANKKVEKNTDLYEKVCNCTKKLDLTDEEIKDIWMKRPVGKAEDIFIFARAILRKANEK